MLEPGRDPFRTPGPTPAGFVPILGVVLVLFTLIALIVTRPGERTAAWAVVGAMILLLLLLLPWELWRRRRDRLQ